jgi:hypothetical protein
VSIEVVGKDEVPAVEAVFTAIGDDVTGFPRALLGRIREQVSAAATVDTDDHRFGLDHAR